VDVFGLRFADSATIRVLLEADRALKEKGGFLELAFPQPVVAVALHLLGVDRILMIRTQSGAGTAGAGTDASLCPVTGAMRGRGLDSGGVPRQEMPGDGGGGMAPDQAFDAATPHELREAVLAEAAAAGLPDDRAAEVMLAVTS
jgi:hypothetical protein